MRERMIGGEGGGLRTAATIWIVDWGDKSGKNECCDRVKQSKPVDEKRTSEGRGRHAKKTN